MTNEQIKNAIAEKFEEMKSICIDDENYTGGFIDDGGMTAVVYFKDEHINIFWDRHEEIADSELVTD